MVQCFAAECNHQTERGTCKSCFRFPKNSAERAKWIRMCRRQDKEPNENSRLCSCHFKDDKKENGPTIFPRNVHVLRVDDPEPLDGALLAVYEALHLLPGTPLIPQENCDFGCRDSHQLAGKVNWCRSHAASSASVLAGTLIQSPFTVLLLFFPDGGSMVFDSHAHGLKGALIARLSQSPAAAVQFLSSLVGPITDCHLCLLRLK